MKRWIALLLCIAMAAALAGCSTTPTPPETTAAPTTTPATVPAPTAAELYAQAAEDLEARDSMKLEIISVTEKVLGADTFKETIKETLDLQGIGTEALKASMTGSFQSGSSYYVETSAVYADGTLYSTIKNDSYRAEMTAGEYLDRQIPAVLLDPALYETVEQAEDGTIRFSGATYPESWIDNDFMIFESAEGTATLDAGGALTASTYKAIYTQGSCKITLDVSVRISESSGSAITVPDAEDYHPVEDPTLVELLYTVSGYIMQAESVSAVSTETNLLQGIMYMTVNQGWMDAYRSGDDQMARFDFTFQGVDLSGQSESYLYTTEQVCMDGRSSYVVDGGEPVIQAYSPSVLHSSVEQYLLGWIPDLDDIETIELTVLGNVALLEYTLTLNAGEKVINGVLDTNLADPDGYRSAASRSTIEKAEGIIGIDAATLMPISITESYSGTHYIDGAAYITSCDYQQNITLGSQTSYETISGEKLPVEEPEEKATPLFYHVTGADGQEMWLLGTIHVGDARTQYLPQEIYDAFDAADALALEFESDAFMEQAETDPEVMAAIMQAYIYTDGTTMEDHISDAALYENTMKLLKATGQYQAGMEVYKPYFASQMLDNYFLDLGYSLSSDYGVDFLLEDRANEQGKEILSVESGLSQIQMLADFSDALQELLLKDTVEYGHVFSNYATQELFELWCAGDEAALTEAIAGDDSELTEEEKVLLEEYNKAMSTDRDAQMLEVAKGYLESGDTVFYAVGLAHLLAESGLVNALRAAGYTVELVSFE